MSPDTLERKALFRADFILNYDLLLCYQPTAENASSVHLAADDVLEAVISDDKLTGCSSKE